MKKHAGLTSSPLSSSVGTRQLGAYLQTKKKKMGGTLKRDKNKLSGKNAAPFVALNSPD